jgi:hypothetical protein
VIPDPRLPWIKALKVGDVVRTPSGLLRIVRSANHGPQRSYFCFTIKHCSWTTRCYTVYTSTDLKVMGWRPTGKRVRLRGHLDYEIEQNIGLSLKDSTLNCCNVEGVS